MDITTENVMTVYGLLARRYNTTEDYVGQVIRGVRKASRGKGQSILRDFTLLQTSLDDWYCHTLSDGIMRVEMPHNITVYVQNGIARVYMGGELLKETDVGTMAIDEFREYLNIVRIEFKQM